MTSITQVLDTFPEKELVAWQLRDPKKAKQVSEEAKRIGTVVDQHIQADCQGRLRNASPSLTIPINAAELTAITTCLRGWEQFQIEHPDFVSSITGIQTELIREEYIGHPDIELSYDHDGVRKDGLVSIKCSGQIRPTHFTQEAGYSWLKNPEVNVDFINILRLDKITGSYEYVELTDPDQIDYEVQVWLNYKVLYEHRQRVAERSRTQREEAVLHDPHDYP